MSVLSLAQMQALAASVGFPDPALAAAVAMAESGGKTDAFNTEGSYGLFQIDVVYNPSFQSNPSVLFDPTTNAKAAYSISSHGTNFKPWTTYRTGLYKQWYTPPAPPASSFPMSHVALAAAGAASALFLGWLAYQEFKSPGYILPRTA